MPSVRIGIAFIIYSVASFCIVLFHYFIVLFLLVYFHFIIVAEVRQLGQQRAAKLAEMTSTGILVRDFFLSFFLNVSYFTKPHPFQFFLKKIASNCCIVGKIFASSNSFGKYILDSSSSFFFFFFFFFANCRVIKTLFCALSDCQRVLYRQFVRDKKLLKMLSGAGSSSSSALEFITRLKKLCNHPSLLLPDIAASSNVSNGDDSNADDVDPDSIVCFTSQKNFICRSMVLYFNQFDFLACCFAA